MKKIYLWAILLTCLAPVYETLAQCTIVGHSVQLVSTTPVSGGNCKVKLNISYTISRNSGNKYSYIHFWTAGTYPSYDYKKAPKAANLAQSLGTLTMRNDVSPVQLLSTYKPDGTVTPIYNGVNLIREDSSGYDKYIFTGVEFTVSGGM